MKSDIYWKKYSISHKMNPAARCVSCNANLEEQPDYALYLDKPPAGFRCDPCYYIDSLACKSLKILERMKGRSSSQVIEKLDKDTLLQLIEQLANTT